MSINKMRILLDTHTFLWAGLDSSQLSTRAAELFLETQHHLYLSIASVWEMAIKNSLGKLTFHKPLEAYILDTLQENAIQLLPIDFRHVTRVSNLPFHHRDPFDRLLISQALEEKISILSCDVVFDLYKIERLW
jgi:PIN domain nuclease of toxin-antitoxin system